MKYGDGKPDGKRSIANSGEMIHFETPEGMNLLRSVKIHGARYGYPQAPKEDFEVAVLSDDLTETLHSERVPYSTFKRTEKSRWTPIAFNSFSVVIAFSGFFIIVLSVISNSK